MGVLPWVERLWYASIDGRAMRMTLSAKAREYYEAHPEVHTHMWDTLLAEHLEHVDHLNWRVDHFTWEAWESNPEFFIRHPELVDRFLDRMHRISELPVRSGSFAPVVVAMICDSIVDHMEPLLAELDHLDYEASFLSGGSVSHSSMFDFVSGLLTQGIFHLTEEGFQVALASSPVGEFVLPNVGALAQLAVSHFFSHVDAELAAVAAQASLEAAALQVRQELAAAALREQQVLAAVALQEQMDLELAVLRQEMEIEQFAMLVDSRPASQEACALGLSSVCILFSERAQQRIVAWFASAGGGWVALVAAVDLESFLVEVSLSIGFTPGGVHDCLFRDRVRIALRGRAAFCASPTSSSHTQGPPSPDGGSSGAAAMGNAGPAPHPAPGGGSLSPKGADASPAGGGDHASDTLGCTLWWEPKGAHAARRCPRHARNELSWYVSLLSLLPSLGHASPPFHTMLGAAVSASVHMDGAPWVPRFSNVAGHVLDTPQASPRGSRDGSFDAAFSAIRPPILDALASPRVGALSWHPATPVAPQVALRAAPPPGPVAPQGVPVAARVALERRGMALREQHSRSVSAFALHPTGDSGFVEASDRVAKLLASSYAPSTDRMDASYMRKWSELCTRMGTPPVRSDLAANSGADAVGFQDEILLQCYFLVSYYAGMNPRSHDDPAADPASAMAALRGVHREHERMGITMAPTRLAHRCMKGLMREYVLEHGIRSVARKKPLDNDKILGMLRTPNGSTLHGLVVDWEAYFWVATKAWVCLLSESGERKDEISKAPGLPFRKGRLTFASLVWKIAGVETPAPTPTDFARMRDRDGVYLKHGSMKNDFFGVIFAATPSFLPLFRLAPRNACRALIELELLARVAPDQRALTPLFGGAPGLEFTHSEVENAFELMMRRGAGVSEIDFAGYSIHSFRIWVASALLSRNVPRHDIKRLLRWVGDSSLDIYARLNDSEWTNHVASTYSAVVDSTIAGRLAALGTLDLEYVALRLARDVPGVQVGIPIQ